MALIRLIDKPDIRKTIEGKSITIAATFSSVKESELNEVANVTLTVRKSGTVPKYYLKFFIGSPFLDITVGYESYSFFSFVINANHNNI